MTIDRQGNSLNIEFDSSRYQSADITKQTLSDFEIRDLKMLDTDIEDIIRRFYRKELKMVKLWRRYKPFINAGVQELITYRVNFSSLSNWRCHGAFVPFYLWKAVF